MRNKFKEFYSATRVDFNNLGEDTIVIFDTNSLLNIYRYSSETSNKFLSALEKISSNIWVPYQVGLEFNLNRKKVMSNINMAPSNLDDEITKILDKCKNQFINGINEYVVKSVDAKDVKNNIIDNFSGKIEGIKEELLNKELESLKILIQTDEDHLNSLINILDGNTGDSYNQEDIKRIIKEGEERYKLSIPPGYEDQKTKKDQITSFNGLVYPSKFGDLIVWKQIIDYANSKENIEKIVFITDDNKPDWWYFIGTQKIGPRAELKNELFREANAELIMINSNAFIQQIEMTDANIVEELVNQDTDWDIFLDELSLISNNKKNIEDDNSKENLSAKFSNLKNRFKDLKDLLEKEINNTYYYNNDIKKLKRLLDKIGNTILGMEFAELVEQIDVESYESYYNRLIELKELIRDVDPFFDIS